MWQLEEICEKSHLQYEVIFSLNKLFYECIPILLCKKTGDQILILILKDGKNCVVSTVT